MNILVELCCLRLVSLYGELWPNDNTPGPQARLAFAVANELKHLFELLAGGADFAEWVMQMAKVAAVSCRGGAARPAMGHRHRCGTWIWMLILSKYDIILHSKHMIFNI